MTGISPSVSAPRPTWSRNLAYFLVGPVTAFVLFTVLVALVLTSYQQAHNGRIYTGISVWGVDLSHLTPTEATDALTAVFPYPHETAITFVDPTTQQTWHRSPASLGLTLDVAQTATAAMAIGRTGTPLTRLREIANTWLYGRSLAPIIVLDDGQLTQALADLSAEINRPSVNASLNLDLAAPQYIPAQAGRQLDLATLHDTLLAPMTNFRQAEVELLVHDVAPTLQDETAVAIQIQQLIGSPMTLYLQEPLSDTDLQMVDVPIATLSEWLRVELDTLPDGSMQHRVYLDRNAAHAWVSQFAPQVYREPVRSRFYFDDDTRELVLVAPHVNGRQLDIDATTDQLLTQALTAQRHVPFIFQDIIPDVNNTATAADLGITQLITETTTWFYGSTDARKHNIARAAANFFGIVIAPGEEFSFNRYLGTVSEADGYEEGFIIVGGRTFKGVGGGVCQVSTTIYQAAFLAGYPIVERWPHGYMVGYYNDGQGPGMDATVFSPIVDFRFTNNTPYHLLIENYYNEEFEALTFKFYSTSLGRRVVKEGPFFENVTEVPGPEQDRWDYVEDVPAGTVQQIDWATEGADVTVHRIVYNANGDLIDEQYFISHYVPIPSLFHYGPGVEPYDYSLVPEE